MECKIISPDKEDIYKNLAGITLPSFYGEMQILPGHAESFIKLEKGAIALKNGKENSIPISEGVCYIKNDKVLIIL